MDCGSSYYDKVFRDPSYIWHEGFCDLPLIESTLETYHVDRLLWLESPGSVRAEVLVKPGKEELPESSSSHGTLSNDTERPTQVDSLAKDSASRNVVMPLLSLVWNGAEPQNYVRKSFGTHVKRLMSTAMPVSNRDRSSSIFARP